MEQFTNQRVLDMIRSMSAEEKLLCVHGQLWDPYRANQAGFVRGNKRLGIPEGKVLPQVVLEYSYKNDELGDPLINDYHALAMEIATREDLDTIAGYAFKINELLKAYMATMNIDLVDFKLEFGKTADGTIILADEISPDTCRFWDMTTHEKLDKDRFRRDLGNVEDAYQEVMKRMMGN